MVREESYDLERTTGRLLQERLRQTKHHLAWVCRRSSLLWLDWRDSKEHRRHQLFNSVLAAQAGQHMERRQYQVRPGADRSRVDEAGRTCGISGSTRVQVRNLFLRAAEWKTPWSLRKNIQTKQNGVGFFSGPIAVVSKDTRLVDRKREKRRNETEAIGETDRMVGKRSNNARVESEEGCELKFTRRSTNLRPICACESPGA